MMMLTKNGPLFQVASLWLWLSFRFKERFPGQATAQVALAKIIALMDLGLENLSKINEGEDARVSTGLQSS